MANFYQRLQDAGARIAARLVQAFREHDPMKHTRPKEDKERIRP